MFSAAVLPWLKATSQCSIRSGAPPCTTESYSQMSPAANTPGAELSRREEQRTPPRSPISQARLLRELHVGGDAGADHDRVRRQLQPVPGDDLRHAAIALEALQLVAAVDRHAVRFEQLLEEAPAARAEAPFERGLLLHHDRAALAHQRQRRGDLAADVGAADQHHLLGVRHPLADRVGVAERAQVVDLLELAAAHVQAAHVRARRDQRLAELDLVLARQRRRARLQVDAGDARARQQLDVLLAPTTRSGGTAAPRGSPRRAGSPSSTPGGCTAGRARGPPAAPRPRRLPRAASARSCADARPPPISR